MNIKSIFGGLMGFVAVVLVGCGGGGGGGGGGGAIGPSYSGTTTQATVTAGNAEDVGTATAEAVGQAVASDENPFGVEISGGASQALSLQQIGEIMRRIRSDLPQVSNLPIGITYTSDELNAQAGMTIFCGGSVSGPAGFLNADSATITFNNLCFDDGFTDVGQIIINGTMSFSYTETATGSTEVLTYSNFTITFNGQTQTLNGTETCEETFDPYSYTCSSTSSYVGDDGLTYQTQDVNVTGDASSGYSVDATVYHPTYGYVTVTTTVAITFNCSNGAPDAGEISFAGSNGSFGTITFDSCTSYTITYDDGMGGSATFTGTW